MPLPQQMLPPLVVLTATHPPPTLISVVAFHIKLVKALHLAAPRHN